MTTQSVTAPRPLESATVRGFKALAALAMGTAAASALVIGGSHLFGQPAAAGPAVAIGMVWAIHLTHERLMGLVHGRGRLGVPDRFARRLAKEAETVARQEADGAWVVLENEGKGVRVLDRKDFEDLAGLLARQGGVMKVLRKEGDGYVVERYEGGVVRSSDDADPAGVAIQTFDRRGNLVSSKDVRAPLPGKAVIGPTVRVAQDGSLTRTPWVSGVSRSEVAGRRLPDYVKAGSELRAAIVEALTRGVVHVRSGTSWLAYEAADEEPRVLTERAHQRARRTSRDHVEAQETWEGGQLTRLTCGRPDSSAHGEPARLSFDRDGRATGVEWFVEGRPSGEAEALEAHAAYRSEPATAAFG